MRYGHYFLSRIYANLGLRWADEGTENKISRSCKKLREICCGR